jgi:hypothetical protein
MRFVLEMNQFTVYIRLGRPYRKACHGFEPWHAYQWADQNLFMEFMKINSTTFTTGETINKKYFLMLKIIFSFCIR